VIRLRAGSTAQTLAQINPNALYVNVAAFGTMLGVGFIGVSAWTLLAPIPSLYRRGALAVVTALGGWCVAMAATFLAHATAGPGALAGLAVASAILALFLGRQAVLSSRK
jgi:crotonobetainyl-CoA:carnitine CoA-transferase CaiB-like acyl-CoA transferase